ncbi:11173_t:CDS:2 [Entrophospora sp. SA101]|nr:8426_t:CDS:2 [Entrophospora sp. SA101]CAJ0894432.1 11173_t:CDS:2 [Entrophospora sp. SA101]
MSNNNDKKRKRNNPICPYGNYRGYYGYRLNGKEDPRINMMKKEWFYGLEVLDIGCNTGIRYSPKLIVGVDIDKELVGCAMVNKRLTYSLSKPTSMSTSTLKSDGDDDIIVRDYFLQSIPAMFGLLPVKSFDDIDFNNDQVKFPDSVQFRCCDWMEEPHSYNKYDTILGLSVSKWIHLNRGDKGLQEFFQRIYDNLRIGGRFIFEPQAWKSYRKYKDLSKTIKNNYGLIKFRPKEFHDYLMNVIKFKDSEEFTIPQTTSFSTSSAQHGGHEAAHQTAYKKKSIKVRDAEIFIEEFDSGREVAFIKREN